MYVHFLRGWNVHRLTNFDIVNFLVKTNDWRDRRPNFAALVAWSASYASAKTLECEESISSSIQLLWATGRLLFTRFYPFPPSG